MSAPEVPADFRELAIGSLADYEADNMTFRVVIRDVRFRYGHLDFLITPEFGVGEKWVDSIRTKPLDNRLALAIL